MQRRGFLQSLMAAAAGLAGAKAIAASTPPLMEPVPLAPKVTTPQVAITADTKPFMRSLDESQRTVMEMLKQCRAIGVSRSCTTDGITSYAVTYTHAPHAPRTPLDSEADEIAGICAPVSVTLTQHRGGVDILDLGGFWEPIAFDRATYDIEVEWRR